ncbi:MAG: OsmC family protein [Gammaproteobacteria bacterium]|nr:OsmC family protein [Gammaproteobacteria bacterium]
MQSLPHTYTAAAYGHPAGVIPISSKDLDPIKTQAPPEFGGPDGFWSPETLLTAIVANCLILTFRAVSRAARFDWEDLDVKVDGTLEKTPEGLRFTEFFIKAELTIEDEAEATQAETLLLKAKQQCLLTASLNGEVSLDTKIRTAVA